MLHLMPEELARAQLRERLERADHQRLVLYVVRLAKARRMARRAERDQLQAQQQLQAQHRLQLLAD